MSSLVNKLTELNLGADAMAVLTYSEGADVFVHNETEVETALSETSVVEKFSALLATPRLNVYTLYGDHVLNELRDGNYLDEYERDFTFEDYLTDAIKENIYEFDFIDRSVEKYDHKRGFCTLTAEVKITVNELIERSPYLFGWDVSIQTDNGTLTLNA
jgi:hypothetical protein